MLHRRRGRVQYIGREGITLRSGKRGECIAFGREGEGRTLHQWEGGEGTVPGSPHTLGVKCFSVFGAVDSECKTLVSLSVVFVLDFSHPWQPFLVCRMTFRSEASEN